MKLTAETIDKFRSTLAETCNVGKACAAAGISRYTAYLWRNKHEEFAEAWDLAMRVGVTALEDEAHRRAFEGIDKPIVHLGVITDTVKEYSDTLAIFLLKAHAPDKYRENSHIKLSGHLSTSEMSDEDIRKELAELAASGVIVDAGSDLV